jgi:c-di-GMP-binding flagellar brake protein YcgR
VTDKLVPNQKVAIQKVSSDDNEFYSSYIAAMEDDTISLATPMHGGSLVLFRVGEEIRVYTWPFMFVTEVLERCFVPHPLIIVRRPRVFTKNQRREFVRLDLSLPIIVRELKSGLAEPIGEEEVQTHTIDISGGGALLVYPKELPAGTWLELSVFLPEEVKCRAQVCRIEHNDTPKKVRLAVEFTDIAPSDQDKIIALIFRRQRELRRRGLL